MLKFRAADDYPLNITTIALDEYPGESYRQDPSEIGTLSPPLEFKASWPVLLLERTLKLLRNVMLSAIATVAIAIAALLVLAFVIEVITHLWFMPVALAWVALRDRHKSRKGQAALGNAAASSEPPGGSPDLDDSTKAIALRRHGRFRRRKCGGPYFESGLP